MMPGDYPWVVPFINVRDPAKALDFYESAFGFERINLNERKGEIVHAELKCQGQVIPMVVPEGLHDPDEQTPVTSKLASPLKFHLFVKSVDEVHKRAMVCGAKNAGDPTNVPWGERYGHVKDLDGYPWQLAEAIPQPAQP